MCDVEDGQSRAEQQTDLLAEERESFMAVLQSDYYNTQESYHGEIDLISQSIWEIISSLLLFVSLIMPYVFGKVCFCAMNLIRRMASRFLLTNSKKKDSELILIKDGTKIPSGIKHLQNLVNEGTHHIESGSGGGCRSLVRKLKYLYILTMHTYKQQTDECQLLILLPFVLWELTHILNLYHHLFQQHTYKFQFLITTTYWLVLLTVLAELLTSTACALMLNVKFSSCGTWESTVEAGAAIVGCAAPVIYALNTDIVDGPSADWFTLIVMYILLVTVNRHLSTVLFNGLIPRTETGLPWWNRVATKPTITGTALSENTQVPIQRNLADFTKLSRKLSVASMLLRVKLAVCTLSSLGMLLLAYLSPKARTADYAYMFHLTAVLVLVHLNSTWLIKYYNDLIVNAEETYDTQAAAFKISLSISGCIGGRFSCQQYVIDRRYYFLIAAVSSVSYCLRAYLTFNVMTVKSGEMPLSLK